MNVFASEKKAARKSPLEPEKKGGLDAPSRAPSNSELLGSRIAPVSAPSKSKDGSLSAGGLSPMSGGGASLLGGPIQAKKPPKVSAPVSQDTDRIVRKDDKTGKETDFMSTQSRALYEMVENATPEQLRTDTTLRQMILDDYKMNMAARLQKYEGDDYQTMFSSVFRANGIGEMETYNKLIKASLPEGMLQQMSQMNDGSQDSVDSAMDFASQQMMNDPVMQEILMAGMDAFGDSKHFSGDNTDRRSEMLMNNVMLRSIAPQFTQKAVNDRNAYADAHMTPDGDKKMHDNLFDESVAKGVGKKDIKLSVDLQKSVKEGGTSAAGSRFKGLLTTPWKTARPEESLDFGSSAPGFGQFGDIGKYFMGSNGKSRTGDGLREGLAEHVGARLSDKTKYSKEASHSLRNASGTQNGGGLDIARLLTTFEGSLGNGMTKDDVADLYEKLDTGGHYADLQKRLSSRTNQKERGKGGPEIDEEIAKLQQEIDSYTPQQVADMDAKMSEGTYQLKGIYFAQLKRMRDKYGKLGSQMHPEDFLKKVGPEFFDMASILQDTEQLMKNTPMYFDFENSEDDREFKRLSDYYNDVYGSITMFASTGFKPEEEGFDPTEMGIDFLEKSVELERMLRAEASIAGPGMDDEQLQEYVGRLQKRMTRGGKGKHLFGRFKKH